MNNDTGLKFYARNHILDNASRVAMECLTRIEATAERLLDGANPKKDASEEKMKRTNILKKPAAPDPSVLVNFRMSAKKKAALVAKLKKGGLSQQDFWDQVVNAYLEGKLT
jgi:hypothetical protein